MNQTLPSFSFGGIQSEPDYRDVPMSAVLGAPAGLPPRFIADVSQLPIWNQRRIGACVGHAAGKKKQEQELDETKQIVAINPRFIYALAKNMDGLPTEGTYYRYGMKVLQKFGAPPEIPEYANDTTLAHADYIDLSKIPQKAYDLAKQYAIASYAQVGSAYSIAPEQLEQAIAQGDGCLLGLQLGKEWWTDARGNPAWDVASLMPLRPPQAVVSGHAIFPYGYEEIGSRLKIYFINSWSPDWGDVGKGWFYFDDYKTFLVEAWGAVDLPNNWQDQIKQLPPASQFKHDFARDIAIGEKNDEVTALQTALMIDGEFSKDLYAQLLGKNELGFYGTLTQKAVADFQKKYAVASFLELLAVNGRRVGLKTRLKLNQLFAK